MSHNPRKANRSRKNENPRLRPNATKDHKSTKRRGGSKDDVDDLEETLWNEPASEPEDEAKKQGEDEEDDEEEGEEYEVEEILDKKIKKGTVLYLVKWKGFSLQDTTWEPQSNLENAPLKIRNFENQLLAKEKEKEVNKDKEKDKDKEKEGTPIKSKISKVTTEQQKEEIKAQDAGSAPKVANKESTVTPKSMDLKKVMEPEALPSKRMRDQVETSKEVSKESTVTDETRKKIKKQAEKGKEGASEVVVPQQPQPEKNIENKKIEKKVPEKPKPKETEIQQAEKKAPKKELKPSMVVEEKAPALQEKTTPMEEVEDELTFKIKKLSGKSNSIRLDSDANVPSQIRKEDSLKEKEGAPEGSEQLYRATSSSLGQTDPEQDKSAQAVAENRPLTSVQNTNKGDEGVSLSRIMQDEKLMEGSETEEPSVNNDAFDTEMKASKPITKIRRKSVGEYGSLEKGDVPLKVVGIRPIKEENDLEVMVSWKARENGSKPYNSKVMRVEMLKYGYWMPLIEFYESKMKLESAPNFDPASLPKY